MPTLDDKDNSTGGESKDPERDELYELLKIARPDLLSECDSLLAKSRKKGKADVFLADMRKRAAKAKLKEQKEQKHEPSESPQPRTPSQSPQQDTDEKTQLLHRIRELLSNKPGKLESFEKIFSKLDGTEKELPRLRTFASKLEVEATNRAAREKASREAEDERERVRQAIAKKVEDVQKESEIAAQRAQEDLLLAQEERLRAEAELKRIQDENKKIEASKQSPRSRSSSSSSSDTSKDKDNEKEQLEIKRKEEASRLAEEQAAEKERKEREEKDRQEKEAARLAQEEKAKKEREEAEAAEEKLRREKEEKEEAEKAAKLKEEQERAAKEKEEAEKAAKLKAEQEKAAREKEEAEKAAKLKEEQEKAAKEKEEAEKAAKLKEEQEKAAKEKEEAEKAAKEKEEAEKAAKLKEEQRKAREKEEAEKAEREKQEAEKAAKLKEEQEKAAKEKKEQEKAAKLEAEQELKRARKKEAEEAKLKLEQERQLKEEQKAKEIEEAKKAAELKAEQERKALQEKQQEEAKKAAELKAKAEEYEKQQEEIRLKKEQDLKEKKEQERLEREEAEKKAKEREAAEKAAEEEMERERTRLAQEEKERREQESKEKERKAKMEREQKQKESETKKDSKKKHKKAAPPASETTAEAELAAGRWKIKTCQKTKRTYYYNVNTRESTWDLENWLRDTAAKELEEKAKTQPKEAPLDTTDKSECEEPPPAKKFQFRKRISIDYMLPRRSSLSHTDDDALISPASVSSLRKLQSRSSSPFSSRKVSIDSTPQVAEHGDNTGSASSSHSATPTHSAQSPQSTQQDDENSDSINLPTLPANHPTLQQITDPKATPPDSHLLSATVLDRQELVRLFKKYRPEDLDSLDLILIRRCISETALLEEMRLKYENPKAGGHILPPATRILHDGHNIQFYEQQAVDDGIKPASSEYVPSAEGASISRILKTMYKRYNPTFVDYLNTILSYFPREEPRLLAMVRQKYIPLAVEADKREVAILAENHSIQDVTSLLNDWLGREDQLVLELRSRYGLQLPKRLDEFPPDFPSRTYSSIYIIVDLCYRSASSHHLRRVYFSKLRVFAGRQQQANFRSIQYTREKLQREKERTARIGGQLSLMRAVAENTLLYRHFVYWTHYHERRMRRKARLQKQAEVPAAAALRDFIRLAHSPGSQSPLRSSSVGDEALPSVQSDPYVKALAERLKLPPQKVIDVSAYNTLSEEVIKDACKLFGGLVKPETLNSRQTDKTTPAKQQVRNLKKRSNTPTGVRPKWNSVTIVEGRTFDEIKGIKEARKRALKRTDNSYPNVTQEVATPGATEQQTDTACSILRKERRNNTPPHLRFPGAPAARKMVEQYEQQDYELPVHEIAMTPGNEFPATTGYTTPRGGATTPRGGATRTPTRRSTSRGTNAVIRKSRIDGIGTNEGSCPHCGNSGATLHSGRSFCTSCRRFFRGVLTDKIPDQQQYLTMEREATSAAFRTDMINEMMFANCNTTREAMEREATNAKNRVRMVNELSGGNVDPDDVIYYPQPVPRSNSSRTYSARSSSASLRPRKSSSGTVGSKVVKQSASDRRPKRDLSGKRLDDILKKRAYARIGTVTTPPSTKPSAREPTATTTTTTATENDVFDTPVAQTRIDFDIEERELPSPNAPKTSSPARTRVGDLRIIKMSVEGVGKWLDLVGFTDYIRDFKKDKITGGKLLHMTLGDLMGEYQMQYSDATFFLSERDRLCTVATTISTEQPKPTAWK